MAVELEEYQFELGGYAFGLGHPVSVNGDGFKPGPVGLITQEADAAAGDYSVFGRDRRTGPTWAFSLHTDKALEPSEALAAKRAIADVWGADATRHTPNATLALRYRVGADTRRCYGRPRNFASAPDNAILNGMLPIEADFKLVEPYWYDDEVRTRTLSSVAALGGGFVFDLVFPISTVAGQSRPGMLEASEIGGDRNAPFEAVIHGPITNPTIEHAGWRIEVIGTVAYDQTVTISTYPWALRARRSDGVNMQLGARTRLSKSLLSKSGGEVKFGGTDTTGTARLDLSWRPRWADW